MSERMNKDRAREIFKSLGKCLSDNEAILRLDEKDIKELTQALDIAIESLEQNIEQIKEKLLEKFKEHCYPVTQKDNSIEDGMTLTGIRQVLNEVFSNIESLDNTMTNREYMHLVGVQAILDTKFDLDKPLEKDFVKFLYALNERKE